MQTIFVRDFSNVIIDDINHDDVFAAIRNFPELKSEIESAALQWSIGCANAAKDVATLTTVLNATAADRDRLAQLLATASEAFDAGDISKLKAMRKDAQKTEKEKALEAAIAEKAAAEAKIAQLSA